MVVGVWVAGRLRCTTRRMADQPGDRIIRDQVGDVLRCLFALGPEPVRRPVQRAEEGARADRGVGCPQHAPAYAVGDHRADAAFVPIPLGDDARAKARWQSIHGQVRRGPFDFVEQA